MVNIQIQRQHSTVAVVSSGGSIVRSRVLESREQSVGGDFELSGRPQMSYIHVNIRQSISRQGTMMTIIGDLTLTGDCYCHYPSSLLRHGKVARRGYGGLANVPT